MTLKMSFKLEKLPDTLKRDVFQRKLTRATKAGVNLALIDLNNKFKAKSRTPVVTGLTVAGFNITPAIAIGKVVTGKVTNPTIGAAVLDQGAKKHFPPTDPESAFNLWVKRKFGLTSAKARSTAFAIAKTIHSQVGLPKTLVYTNTFIKNIPRMRLLVKRQVDAAIERFNK